MTSLVKAAPQAIVREPSPDTRNEPVDFPSLVTMGDQLVKTGFLPDHIRTGPQFAAIVMTGKELGMTPMRAVRTLRMVKGKVEEDAASQLARFKVVGGRASFAFLDETRAELHLVHPNGDKHVEIYTIDDAKRAGLTTSQTWKSYPKAMLRSRCITSGLKSVGWDGAVGTYDIGEVQDAPAFGSERAPEVVDAPPPPPKSTLNQGYILDVADLIVGAIDDPTLTFAMQQIANVVDDSEKGQKMAFALESLCEAHAAKLADVDWVPAENADEAAKALHARRKAAVGWIRGLMEARTLAVDVTPAPRPDKVHNDA